MHTGPAIIDKPAMQFVGLTTPFIHILSPDSNGEELIPELWGKFAQRKDNIPNRNGEPLYGVIHGCDQFERSHADELTYMCAATVSNLLEVPDDMERFEVPHNEP